MCVCLPSGLSADGGRGLGTLGFPPDLAEPMFHSSSAPACRRAQCVWVFSFLSGVIGHRAFVGLHCVIVRVTFCVGHK